MNKVSLPSLEIGDQEKRLFTEADVHSKLFEPDMRTLGYPRRESTQADGAYFLEQRTLAMRRLKSKRQRGHFDGLYLLGNAPIVLCELKRYEEINTDGKFKKAVAQLQDYARSEDFRAPPPFLLLYSGRHARTAFFRRRTVAEGPLLDEAVYEQLDEIWTWERVQQAHLKGAFAEEVVSHDRLLQILLHHLDQIEDSLRADVAHAVQIVSSEEAPAMLTEFGRFLVGHDQARQSIADLYERKRAEVPKDSQKQVVEEMVTQAALSYLNKVFFLNLCEDRNLQGFYRIMREFLPATRAETTPTTATMFLGLLRRKIKDSAGDWSADDDDAYWALRGELTSEIRDHVIEQNNWWQLIRVAFDLAEERFPLIYREDAYDNFHPDKNTLAELIYDLSTKSFSKLTNRDVGGIYQGLLSSRRRPAPGQKATPGRSGRQAQQATLGAFYTPRGDVDYMVSRLGLRRDSVVLDPCMGSGHFLEGIYEALAERYADQGHDPEQIYRQVVGKQIYGGDIDSFATSLAAIRVFLLDDEQTQVPPNLFVHDMLLHSPERPGDQLFSPEVLDAEGTERAHAKRAVSVDPNVDEAADVDKLEFDAVVGNPPYGARKPEYKKAVYAQLYGSREKDLKAGSVGTGDADTYSMFFANGIERLKEGGRMCLITNDSFRTLTTHARLRRYLLDRCKIVEILLTDTKHFEGVSFQFAGMAITTLEKCSDSKGRAENTIRLVDYVRDPDGFADPSPEKVTELRQDEYEALPETPFFVGVPREVFEAAKTSEQVGAVAKGRQGLATADDKRFLAGIDATFPGLSKQVSSDDVTSGVSVEERKKGISSEKPHWVPFAKGEGFGEYWRPPKVAIDWSAESVAELETRDKRPAGTSRRPRLQNRAHYFQPGLSYSVVSSGRVSARLMPEGWIFGHKGSAVFVEDKATSELFLLGYLNSSLATYFMKKLVNTTATADIGYVEKLPFRRPAKAIESLVVSRVEKIVGLLQADPEADTAALRREIDDAIFELFEIQASRAEVREFYETIGKAEPIFEPQAASE